MSNMMDEETKKALDKIVEWVKKETPEKVATAYMGLLAQYKSLKDRLENVELKERVRELEDNVSSLKTKVNQMEKKDDSE
jgi:hypothetical protein